MTQTVVAGVGWCGWHRPRNGLAWTLLAKGDTYEEAWGLLLDALRHTHGGDSQVVRAGCDPNGRPSGRQKEATP